MKIDFKKSDGLVPAIVQDADTQQVLMLGYMNAEAVKKTRKSGFVTFYSRSRQTIWQKGETSGNTLSLIDMKIDCDQDSILIQARPAGPTCHLGTTSCFGDEGPEGLGFLADLTKTIEQRRAADPQSSYTASLLQGPLTRTAQKVGEEGVETVIAALAQSDEAFLSESADLLYHLMVLLGAKGHTLQDVVATLKARSH
ncbi:MAG: bifunctional phosphoribosyl-AMP cyclohydrolase/phosphoribosyl-ATP diphosphatase HisIE [Acidimicrobiales bacterium]|nr:MAG: bifunctional phosphoribosyl-AMP cyclohydrolase/phosphoribosyl-ATP diphosphatase HisIE [Acidimicrobiales bacterium]